MLSTPATYPHVGSFALYIDADRPMPRAELVRIMRLDAASLIPPAPYRATIAFPNRVGSSGNKTVPMTDLIDATPLSKEEERELTDGQRDLRGRGAELSRRLRAVKLRTEALRSRQLSSIILEHELNIMRARADREARRSGATTGRMMLDDSEYGPSGGRTERRDGRNITGEAA